MRTKHSIAHTGRGMHPSISFPSSGIQVTVLFPQLFLTLQRGLVTLLHYFIACLHSYLLTEIPGWGPRLLGTTLFSAVQCRSMHAHVVTLWLAFLSGWCKKKGTAGLKIIRNYFQNSIWPPYFINYYFHRKASAGLSASPLGFFSVLEIVRSFMRLASFIYLFLTKTSIIFIFCKPDSLFPLIHSHFTGWLNSRGISLLMCVWLAFLLQQQTLVFIQ